MDGQADQEDPQGEQHKSGEGGGDVAHGTIQIDDGGTLGGEENLRKAKKKND